MIVPHTPIFDPRCLTVCFEFMSYGLNIYEHPLQNEILAPKK